MTKTDKSARGKRFLAWWRNRWDDVILSAAMMLAVMLLIALVCCMAWDATHRDYYSGWKAYIELPSADVIYGTVDWATISDGGVVHASIDGVEYATSSKLFTMWKGELPDE